MKSSARWIQKGHLFDKGKIDLKKEKQKQGFQNHLATALIIPDTAVMCWIEDDIF